jgi:purine-cytosine permease-like protein
MRNTRNFLFASLYVVLPLAVLIIAYLFGVLVKCEFDVRLWSEKERILLAMEGLLAMIIGFLAALTANTYNK